MRGPPLCAVFEQNFLPPENLAQKWRNQRPKCTRRRFLSRISCLPKTWLKNGETNAQNARDGGVFGDLDRMDLSQKF